jgi:hypothetical protein
MYGYGYRYNSGLVIGAGGGAPFANTKSLQFDGIDDFVSCGNIAELSNATAFTISGWYKQTTLDVISYMFGSYIDANNRLIAYTWSNGLMTFQIEKSGANFYARFDYSTVVTAGQWFNFSVIYDGGGATNADKVKIYIDGVSQTLSFIGAFPTSAPTGTNVTTIGKVSDAAQTWNGSIDEVCLLDRVATPTEIVTLSTAPTVDLTDLNPIAWYRNGDNGAWKSPQWLIPNNENFAAKVSNYSFEFDGVDDYINTGASTLSGETALTISAWVYPTAYGDATVPSFVSTDEASPRAFYLGLFNGTNFRFSLSTNGANLTSLDTGIGTVDLNTWQHILVTWDQVNLKLYKNGTLLKTVATTFASNGTFTTTNDLLIGARRSDAGFFNGNIDEVAIWNSVQDASTIYNSGTPTTISGAVAHYKMGENATFLTNWTVPDSVGTNNGTSANMTIEDRIGEAPNSTNNAVSFNMDEVDRTTDVPT